MACTNISKPDVTQRPNNIYGAPQGQSGRTFDNVDYGIQAIILHCTDMTISQYVQYLACLSQPVLNISKETNHHYSIGSAGALNQHVADENISWTFGNYSADAYPNPPTPTRTIEWPTLQGINGASVSPDVYAINIVIAKSYNQGTNCLTSSGLPSDQHDKLLQLIAHLASTYNIPIDSDYINWHDNIATQAHQCNECSCTDIACLIADINSYCDEDDCDNITYTELDCEDISHLLAVPDSCANSSGCLVSVPFDACCFGALPQVGEVEEFVGVATDTTSGKLCLVKDTIRVIAPLTGEGTVASPLAIDLCEWGDFVPLFNPCTGDCPQIATFLAIDDDGCLVQATSDLIAGFETPLTVIDSDSVNLTSSGTNGHTLEAAVILSSNAGNILQIDPDGLYATISCTSLAPLFNTGSIFSVYGVDDQGDCVFEEVEEIIQRIICETPISDAQTDVMHLLGRDVDLECPVFFTPTEAVFSGLGVENTLTVDLTMTQDPQVSPLNIITADVIIDPASENILQVTPEGLYVAPISVAAQDNCIDVAFVNNQVTVGLILDPKINNIANCGPNGLYVDDLVPMDTNCIELVYNTSTRELTANPILSGPINNIANALTCEDGGLYVPQAANLTTNPPLVGSGVSDDPLDIDFSLMNNQDLCDFGSMIPEALALVDIIGLDENECLRQYTGQEFINQFLEILDTTSVNLTLTGNVLSADAIISPALGGISNVLSDTPTGLYVPLGAGIVPTATNCMDVQLVNGVLTVTPIFDPDPDNQVTCNANGLFVPRGAGVTVENTDCILLDIVDGVITSTPRVSGAILGTQNALSCEASGLFVPVGSGLTGLATDCMTVIIDGDGNISVNPIISNLADNKLVCDPSGLYVPDGFITAIANTDCIELVETNGVLTAVPIIDPDLENLVDCTANGFFSTFSILDTPCMDVQLNQGILTVAPIIDGVSTNLLTCGVNGLLAELNSNIFTDSDCIEFTVTNGLVTADPILAPDQGPLTNVLRCLPDGLFVPVAAGLEVLNGSCVELQLINGLLTAEVIIDPDVDNAITCGPDGLFVEICCPLVEDTTTVNLTLDDPRTISAEVIIDPDPTNALVANPLGLYVPEDFIQAVIDTNCLTLSVTAGVLSINPIISGTANNQLECLADGFFVPSCCPEVVDTNSVDLTLINPTTIRADVIIDPLADNALFINPNGLYVPPNFIDTVLATNCMTLDVTGGVLTVNPIISPLADNRLTCQGDGLYVPGINVVDSNCIDLDFTADTLTANIIISAQPNNIVECINDGLFAEAPIRTVSDTNCISLILNAGELTAAPIIDPDLTNQLTCDTTGLFVPEPVVTAIDNTQCIELNITTGVLTATPIIDPAVDNQLICGLDGLYVPPITAVDTNCIDVDITNNVLTVNPIISVTADNAFQCLGDGMYVPKGANATGLDTDCLTVTVTDGVISVDPIIDPSLDNQLQCLATGLFVAEPLITAVADTNCLSLTVTAGALTVDPIVSPLLDNTLVCQGDGLYVPPMTVVDTDCINLTFDGVTLTAEIIVDPAIDNILTCQGTGLYVPELTVNDTACISLDLTGRVLTATPIISVTADNQIDCIGDGLFVEKAAGLEVLDSDCFDFSITDGVITGSPIISGNLDNILTCEADGLYVPEGFITAVADTNCISPTVTAGVLTIDPIIDPAADNVLVCQGTGLYVPQLVVNNTACMSLDITGGVITATPILSATVDNQLQCIGDGLYVPQGGGLTGLDTDCLSTTVLNGEVSVEPIVAGTQGGIANSLVCIAGEGLYVPAGADLIVIDGNCVDLTLTNGNILQAEIIIDPAADNLAVCNLGTGLYVPPMTPIDTNCITIDITNNILTIDTIIAPDQLRTNILDCLADGLYVPETEFTRNVGGAASGGNTIDVDTDGDGVTDFTFCEGFCTIVSANDCIEGVGADYAITEFSIVDQTLTINSVPEHTSVAVRGPITAVNIAPLAGPSLVNNENTEQHSTTLSVTNPSLCRSMAVTVSADMRMSIQGLTAGGLYGTNYQLDSSISGPLVNQVGQRMTGVVPVGTDYDGTSMSLTFTEIIAPGATVTYTAREFLLIDVAGFPVTNSSNVIAMMATGTTV